MSSLLASGPAGAKLVLCTVALTALTALTVLTSSIPEPAKPDAAPSVEGAGSPNPPRPTTGDGLIISGSIDRLLTPDTTAPVNISLTNSNTFPLAIEELTVEIQAVRKQPGANGRCGAGDFTIRQFSGASGFVVGASRTRSLAELGFTPAQMPQITMVNLPKVNQDGCKNAQIDLKLTATTEATS